MAIPTPETGPTSPFDEFGQSPDSSLEQELALFGDERLRPFQNSPQLFRFVHQVTEAAQLDPDAPGDRPYLEAHIGLIRLLRPDIAVSEETLRDMIAQSRYRYLHSQS